MTGVWVMAELDKALMLGYKVAKIDEVWHVESCSDGLLKGYIHTFL